ncbi:MAG: hypothetical protein E6J45_02090 [Chloroflexi bacterium]|nr:MAG: hypothetical protein E6J45_02090 [Chloroflexota bacterium]
MRRAKSAHPPKAAAALGKKQRKHAGSVEALQAILAQTRAAQRRLLALAARLRTAEQAILAALGDEPGAPSPAPVRRQSAAPAKAAAPSANGRRRPARPL